MEWIGVVYNDVKEPTDQAWGAVVSEIVLDESLTDGLDGIEAFSHLLILFWMHRAAEAEPVRMRRHPQGREDIPEVGIFAQRARHRPNPIGVTAVQLLRREKNRLFVQGLDAIHGTPVVDVKPYVLAIEKARAANMPKENIERSIKRGTGEDKEAAAFEEFTLEGYGPHGSAFMVECLTDNRNRTVADVRHTFGKVGGNMAEAGAVGWQFDRKSYFAFPKSALSYDKAFELAIEAGADDVLEDGDNVEIIGPVESFKTISDALKAAKVLPDEAGLRMIAKQDIELNVQDTLQVLKAVETIEDLDDVQHVYHNLKISEEALAALEAE